MMIYQEAISFFVLAVGQKNWEAFFVLRAQTFWDTPFAYFTCIRVEFDILQG